MPSTTIILQTLIEPRALYYGKNQKWEYPFWLQNLTSCHMSIKLNVSKVFV